jgi:hypothetical protein
MLHPEADVASYSIEQHLSAAGDVAHCMVHCCLLRHSTPDCLVCMYVVQVAIKQLDRPHLVLRYVESELVNHSQLRHPHVVQFREVFLTEQHVSSLAPANTAQQCHRVRNCYP